MAYRRRSYGLDPNVFTREEEEEEDEEEEKQA
jgi:hypothetical protein